MSSCGCVTVDERRNEIGQRDENSDEKHRRNVDESVKVADQMAVVMAAIELRVIHEEEFLNGGPTTFVIVHDSRIKSKDKHQSIATAS